MRQSAVIDLTVPVSDTFGRSIQPNIHNLHAGDTVRTKAGSYIVTNIKHINGKHEITLKAFPIIDGNKSYTIVVTNPKDVSNAIKDMMVTGTPGTNNPTYGGKMPMKHEDEDDAKKAGRGGMTLDVENVVDPGKVAEKKRQEVTDKLHEILEVTKNVTNMSFVSEPVYGTKFVTKTDIEKKNEQVTGNGDEEGIHNAKPVPDPTDNLAPRANSWFYPYGKEPEASKEKPKTREDGITEDNLSDEALTTNG